jgi:hypothetical protein
MNKSLLPKLLARENVTIQHGNFKTAWFDIKNRVLGLPLWDNMHKDVYDLFVGHEVGHALETPFEGWHDSPEKLKGCPRSYINVIEDARIERKVQARYPGLVGSFNRGYEQLLKREFFGPLTDVDWDQVKLIDKINLKTKLGTKLEVPFTPEENTFLTRSLTTETFDEVLDLVRDILNWTNENQEELMQKPEPQESTDTSEESESQDPTENMGHDDMPSEEKEEERNTEDSPSEERNTEDSPEAEEESEDEVAVAPAEPVHSELTDESVTDTIFREMEKTLTMGDDEKQPSYIGDVNKEALDKIVINYTKLKASRIKHDAYMAENYRSKDPVDPVEFRQYVKGLKKNVQVAVKEFEMRKAAYQNTRATTAKTGTIDVNKLWSYKTNEDIFLQSTKLANAKNHGMMLLIDMSGSMVGSMPQVMEQVMHLVMFCKATNIPFDVYGFTSTNPDINYEFQKNNPGVVDLDNLSMPHICSSTFSKSDFMDSMEHMYTRLRQNGWGDLCRYEEYGSTPLNQALMVSTHLVKKFKAKHGIEKMNFITFTDGDANRISTYSDWSNDNMFRPDRSGAVINVDGTMVKSRVGSRSMTSALLKNMTKKYGINTIGFFMADTNSDWRQRLWIMADELNKFSEEYKSGANKEYRINKCVHEQNVLGYNEYYLVKGGKNLETQEDEFAVADDASNASIRTAFKKFSKSKKQNKVLLTKFGKAVA